MYRDVETRFRRRRDQRSADPPSAAGDQRRAALRPAIRHRLVEPAKLDAVQDGDDGDESGDDGDAGHGKLREILHRALSALTPGRKRLSFGAEEKQVDAT